MTKKENIEPVQIKAIQRISVTDSVVNNIRAMILEGKFQPGEKLPTENSLCDSFGVSRTCVREAMRVLQALSLVTLRPGKGAFVSETLGIDQTSLNWFEDEGAKFNDFIEVRMALEVLSTRLAIMRAKEKQVHKLEEIHKSFLEANKAKSLTKMIMLDELFHTEIVNITGNKLLMNINRQLVGANKKYRSEAFLDNAVYQNAITPHTRILECFQNKNPEKGAEEMFKHLSITKSDMEFLIKKKNPKAK